MFFIHSFYLSAFHSFLLFFSHANTLRHLLHFQMVLPRFLFPSQMALSNNSFPRLMFWIAVPHFTSKLDAIRHPKGRMICCWKLLLPECAGVAVGWLAPTPTTFGRSYIVNNGLGFDLNGNVECSRRF